MKKYDNGDMETFMDTKYNYQNIKNANKVLRFIITNTIYDVKTFIIHVFVWYITKKLRL